MGFNQGRARGVMDDNDALPVYGHWCRLELRHRFIGLARCWRYGAWETTWSSTIGRGANGELTMGRRLGRGTA